MSDETNVFTLLALWGLSDLQSKFKIHQIESRALNCLTEKDICELIPKIGRRAIFRSSLKEWRRRNINIKQRDPQPPPPPLSLRISARVVEPESSNNATTTNTNNEEISTPILNTVIKDEQMHSDYESEEISENMQIHNYDDNDVMEGDDFEELDSDDDEESLENPLSTGIPSDVKKFNVVVPTKRNNSNSVNVSEILSRTPEGRTIIAYYAVHGSFDYSHRRRLVTVIINEVVEKNKWLVQEDFDEISHQIIQLFPREDVATYYMSRKGLKNPKGCLYNKFLNLTRKLRQEGILQYRNNVQIMPERISARHSGEIKCYTESC